MNALTQAQLDGLNGVWRAENIDDDSYVGDWQRGFNSAARSIRKLVLDGASADKILADFDYIDIEDERWCDDWERGSYSLYRAVKAVLTA